VNTEGPRLHRIGAQLRSIRFRIVATFLAALLAMLGSQGFLIWQQRGVNASVALLTDTYTPLAKAVAQLERDRQRAETDVSRLARAERRPVTGASSPALVYTDQIRIDIGEGRIHTREALRRDLPAEERAALNRVLAHLDRIESLFRDYQAGTTQLVALFDSGDVEAATLAAQPLLRDGQRLREEIQSLGRLVDARIEQLDEATARALVRANAVAGLLTAVAVALAVFLVGVVIYALRPIARLTTEVQRVAAGDYGGPVEVRGGHEIAVLAGEFNAMVRALELRDRTLVERAEQLNRLSRYLASVLDSLEDGLLVVEEGRVTLANPAAGRVWGVAQDQAPPAELHQALAHPGRHAVEGPDGTLQEVRTTPFGDNGQVLVTEDVTEQTRAREQLARSERLALVGQMLAQITHEVRNPLNALSLNAELLSDELSALDRDRATEAWDILATIASEVDRLTAVTGHYLQLARRPPARHQPEDLRALVEDVARLLDAELSQRSIGLSLDIAPVPPQLVDGNQLRQALLNVVRNAAEAGGRSLRLSLHRDAGQVVLALTDDGPGMSEVEIERACDPFFSTKTGGTGLGLAITKQILDDHDGNVRITSNHGGGTTVALCLPERPVPVEPEPRTSHVADHPGRR